MMIHLLKLDRACVVLTCKAKKTIWIKTKMKTQEDHSKIMKEEVMKKMMTAILHSQIKFTNLKKLTSQSKPKITLARSNKKEKKKRLKTN